MTTGHRTGSRARTLAAGTASAIAIAIATSACGGGLGTSQQSSGTIPQPAPGQTVATVHSLPRGNGGDRSTAAAKRHTGPNGEPVQKPRPASRKSAEQTKEGTGKRVKAPNPCSYVTAADATAAFHAGSVTEVEGRLGPTCIFTKGSKGRQLGTLAIVNSKMRPQVRDMQAPRRETISGHSGYCGKLGEPLLLLSLNGERTLSIHAPCSQARVLAARALRRIKL